MYWIRVCGDVAALNMQTGGIIGVCPAGHHNIAGQVEYVVGCLILAHHGT